MAAVGGPAVAASAVGAAEVSAAAVVASLVVAAHFRTVAATGVQAAAFPEPFDHLRAMGGPMRGVATRAQAITAVEELIPSHLGTETARVITATVTTMETAGIIRTVDTITAAAEDTATGTDTVGDAVPIWATMATRAFTVTTILTTTATRMRIRMAAPAMYLRRTATRLIKGVSPLLSRVLGF